MLVFTLLILIAVSSIALVALIVAAFVLDSKAYRAGRLGIPLVAVPFGRFMRSIKWFRQAYYKGAAAFVESKLATNESLDSFSNSLQQDAKMYEEFSKANLLR